MSLAPDTPDNRATRGGHLTPGTIATQFSKLDLPAPSSLQFPDANSSPATSTGDSFSPNLDLSSTLAHLTLPDPEAVQQARANHRRDSISEQLSARLGAMQLPQPERIFGPESVDIDSAPNSATSKGKQGVSAADWDKIKLDDEVPEAIKSPHMTHSRNSSVVEASLRVPTIQEDAAESSHSAPKLAKEQKITPFDVEGGVDESGKLIAIDYDKISAKFGAKPITPELLEKFERLTGRKAHPLLRRGTFFSHRDFDIILKRYEEGKPFYLYTGRGPSSGSMHLGHLIPFKFTAWLQEVFDVPLVIQLTDDEKYLLQRDVKKQVTLEENYKFGLQNVQDIIACGVNPDKTFIFSDLDYMGGAFYKNIVKIAKCITLSQSKNIFGFSDSDNVGMYHFAAVQGAPAFSSSFPQIFGTKTDVPALIPCAIDQDPYFLLCRDAAVRLKFQKPSLLHAKFLPALQGAGTKMSASDPNTAIYMTDTAAQIKNKIKKHAFSGGGATQEEHRQNGGNVDVDIAYQYMSFFVEDDAFMDDLATRYKAGTLSTSEMKEEAVKVLQEVVGDFQEVSRVDGLDDREQRKQRERLPIEYRIMAENDDALAQEIVVPSEDPVRKDEDKPVEHAEGKDTEKADKDKQAKDDEISEEDLQLKAELEMLVERLKESDTSLYLPALESLRTLIRTSTSSMTSVPKPLKFLRPHYEDMGKVRESWDDKLVSERSLLASILSVLAMTYSDTGKRDTLRYRLLSQATEAPGLWGHEYVRHLASELGEEYNLMVAPEDGEEEGGEEKVENQSVQGLRALGIELVNFFLKHNAEADAVDLLLELENIADIEALTDDKTYARVCQYMTSCVPLLVPPDDSAFLKTAAAIYAKHDRFPEALALAVRLNDRALIRKYYEAPTNPVMKKQLSYFLARAQIPIHWVHTPQDTEPEIPEDGSEPAPELSEDVLECLGNSKLSQYFKNYGKAVGVEEPRAIEDIYKSHLETSKVSLETPDSARQNLASTFVNAFVNAGFGNEKMIVKTDTENSWIYKNKDHGMMSATASAGMSMLWDSEAGIDVIDKYTYSAEENIKAGALLAMGILHSGITTDPDVAFALLEEHVDSKSAPLKISAINGIAIAYAGSNRSDIGQRLLPHVADETNSIEVASQAALAMGFVYVGSGDGEIASTILQTMMEREESQLTSEWAVFMVLALGLVYLGQQDASDATVETLKAIEHPLARQAEILVNVCSYAGTGNVLKVQDMLHICSEHAQSPKPKKDETEAEAVQAPPAEAATASADEGADVVMGEEAAPAAEETKEEEQGEIKPRREQAIAVIGIALIAMGEDVGAEMALRQFQHLMTYGDPIIRKSVPLALGLISASNPQLSILDTLSKYSHDSDLEVALNAILAMGIVGAGTNNARLAQMLRQLAEYYAKEADCFFMVRIAQGLVHMGKGTIGINPFFNDNTIMSKTAIAGLLSVLISFIDAKSFVLEKQHWMLYWLVTAMYPQFLITLDEEMQEKAITVRVGQAVNTVGTAGQRHGISGFQTHQTPVRIGTGERAELGTNEFFPYTSVLENLVIIKKNPGYDAKDMQN
ncbi:26S proteasome regulatory subunit N1, partial [Tremellales sp. Uapishka_1]